MHIDWSQIGETAGHAAGFFGIALLCLAGLVLSALTFSGTWLVLGATLLAAWLRGPKFPGIATIVVFVLICIAIDIVEWFAGSWGVQKRGGSKLAGLAALLGGFAGMFLGTFIPIPLVGSLIGMIAGSFGFAYLVERNRLKKHDPALHIATGAVLARIAILLLKVTATFGMILTLFIGMLIA
jgi:uncharacterized protein YqgC (DUF456 family)